MELHGGVKGFLGSRGSQLLAARFCCQRDGVSALDRALPGCSTLLVGGDQSQWYEVVIASPGSRSSGY